MEDNKQLSLINVDLGYDSNPIVKGVNLTINQGDYVCVIGENGAGKSTFLKTVLGLVSPVNGTIDWNIDKNEIGYLPQQTIVQRDFPASVKEVVMSGFQNKKGLRPFYTKEEKAEALNNMKRMSIEDLSSKSYKQLSGGQQQRVLLARALCATKKILFLDEPVSGLDPKVTADMYSLIKSLNDEGITVVMISHDVNVALNDASHILYISENVFWGEKKDFIDTPQGKLFLSLKGGN